MRVGNQINKWSMAKFGICITEYSRRRLTETIGRDNLPNKVFIAPMGTQIQITLQGCRPISLIVD